MLGTDPHIGAGNEGLSPFPDEEPTRLLGGKLLLLQSAKGFRMALDTLALAGFCRLEGASTVLDLGAGNGALSLLLARRFTEPRFTLLELQEGLAGLARRNLSLNRVEDRIEVVQGDLCRADLFPQKSFRAVATNPPYLPLGQGRLGPDRERNLARHELRCTLDDWTRAAARWLASGGSLFAVFPAKRLTELLAVLPTQGLIPRRLRMVRQKPGGPEILALVEARSGGSPGELAVEPPLFADRVTQDSIPE